MRKAGALAAQALDMLYEFAQPGVTTAELDRRALEFALDNNAVPATLNYRAIAIPFAPASIMWCATAFQTKNR